MTTRGPIATARRLPTPLGVALAAPVALALLALAQPDRRPTERVRDCTSGGCHAGELAAPFLHGPTAVSACDTCHVYKDPRTHSFTLKGQGRELCDFCHIDKVGTEGPVVHQPVAEGDCLSCHDPHGGTTRKLIRFDSTGALCADCHAQTTDAAHVHEPAALGDCTSCHEVHTAQHPSLLVTPGRALCISCHEQTAADIHTSPHVHEPALGECLECHTSHASPFPRQLKATPRELCVTCHEDVAERAQTARFTHPPVLEDQACMHCHLPHASRSSALRRDDPAAACLTCHKEQEEKAATREEKPNPAAPIFVKPKAEAAAAAKPARIAPPAPELTTRLAFAHGPVAEADCGACHDLHGGAHDRLLSKPYTDAFYAPYSSEAYALCFGCHDERLALEHRTTDATGFRDGTTNLHALHVNSEQGRTCRACHNTHASNSRAQIRDSAPFGEWRIPLNFELTDTGGSCAPGCHRPASYDRGDATPPTGPTPAAGPAPAPRTPAGG